MKKHLWILTMLLGICIAQLQAQVTLLEEHFEDGIPATWTLIDADGDNKNWQTPTYVVDPLYGNAHTGFGYAFSTSNNAGAQGPDNWLVTPPLTLGSTSTLTFYRRPFPSPPQDHYGVYISTTSPTDLTSFTLLYEETPTAQTNSWESRLVDLSGYSGTVYIAFRHYNTTNQRLIALDDITVTTIATTSTIVTFPTVLSFEDAVMGVATQPQQLTVAAYNITTGLTATTAAPFEVSSDNINYSATATLADTGGVLYVRYFPTDEGTDNGTLTITDGMASQTVLLLGSNQDCSYITLPYSQNFDSVETSTMPACWQRINTYYNYGLHYPNASENNPYSGVNSLEFENDFIHGTPTYVILPLMPQTINNLQISFWSRRGGASAGTLSVGYMNDLTNTNSFVPVWSTSGATAPYQYEPISVSFQNVMADLSQDNYIVFKYQATAYYSWYVDDILVEEIPTCPKPNDLTASMVTSHTATLSWTGSADSYVVYYRPTMTTEWDSISNVILGDDGFVLNNLTASTSYEWYVASICPNGTLSNSMGISTFTTDCEIFTAPFSEDFDADNDLPNCWSKMTGWASEVFAGYPATAPVSPNWGFTRQNVFGQYHPVLNIYGSSCKHWLVSPAIDLSTLTNPVLTFDLALTLYASADAANPHDQLDDKFMVVVSTDNGATWSAANATVWSNDGLGDYVFNQIPASGQEVNISLAAYTNQTVRIAFYGESSVDNNGDNDLHIDNVMVMQGSSCPKPTQLMVTNVDSNAVTLGWTEMGDATSWNIKYGPVGFDVEDSTATMIAANVNPFTVTNLAAGASYDFYVQANCGNEPSLWVGPVTATPSSYNIPANGTATLTTCAMAIYDDGGMNGNYSSACNGVLVIYPAVEGNYITVSGSYNTEENFDYLRVYDGVGTNGTLLGEYSGTGNVPVLVASVGPLTLQFTSDNALQKSGFELFVECVSCAPPANVTVTDLSSTTAAITWDNNSALTWMVEYKAENDSAWETMTTSDTTITLENLNPLTTYLVQVASECGTGYSNSFVLTFTTPMQVAQLPYNTDFDATSDRNWTFYNGSCTNHWMIGGLNDSVSALFVTYDDINASYNTNSYSVVSAEKLFTVGQANEVNISFDVKVGGEGNFDFMKVFFAPADVTYPASTDIVAYAAADYQEYAVDFTDYLQYSGSGTMPYMFNLTSGNIVHVEVSMPNPNDNPTATSTGKLVFLWKNDQDGGTTPGAIIYNVAVAASSCSTPSGLTASNVTTNSAEITWNSEATTWNLEYKEASGTTWTPVTVTGTPSYQLTGLTAATVYNLRVQAVCGGSDVSLWSNVTFTTICDVVSTFPYTEDFEHDGDMPDCWTQEYLNGMVSWTAYAGNHGTTSSSHLDAHSGSYNACYFNSSNVTTKLITPPFDLTSLTNPYVTYWYSQAPWGSDIDNLKVYYRTSPADEWHVLAQYFAPIAAWTMDSLPLPTPSASYQLAFEGHANYGYGITLDDITIDGAVVVLTEPTATTAAATNVEQTSATLNGSISNPDNVTITAQGFEWKASVGGTYAAVNVPGVVMTYNLTGLTASTEYTYRAFVTTANGTYYGDEVTFTTSEEQGDPCETPTDIVAIDLTSSSITLSWTDHSDAYSWNIAWSSPSSQYGPITISEKPYTIVNLLPNTTYIINLQTICPGIGESEWTDGFYVTTLDVGINEYLETRVSLYPNPAKEFVDVRIDGDVNVTGLEVYDVYGKVVRTVVGANNDSPIQINVSDLSAGMYFVRVMTDRGMVTKRFVKK